MAAFTLGFPEIERQLRLVRRRRNAFALQHALYSVGGLLALLAALLIVIALRGQTTVFRLGFWASVVIVIAAMLPVARQAWRGWLLAASTARWVDRTAHLDDRLATMAAQHAGQPKSRLTNLVLTQLLTLRHRWQPNVLVTRSVPRSAYFFAVSLLVLLATTFLERPPAAPRAFLPGGVVAGHQQTSSELAGPVSIITGRAPPDGALEDAPGDGGASADDGKLPGDRRLLKDRTGKAKAAGRAGDDPQGVGLMPASMAKSLGLSPDGMEAEDVDALPEQLQNRIRQAFGMPPVEEQRKLPGETTPDHRQIARSVPGAPREPPKTDERGGQRSAAGSEQAQQPERGAPARSGERSDDSAVARPDSPGGSQPSGGAGGGRGAGDSKVLGNAPPLGEAQKAAKMFQVKLSSLAHAVRSVMEPQTRGKVGDVTIAPPSKLPSEIRLSDQDAQDDPLVRAPVSVEHEALVKRIFSHGE